MVPPQRIGRGDRSHLGRAAETVGNLSIEASHLIILVKPNSLTKTLPKMRPSGC